MVKVNIQIKVSEETTRRCRATFPKEDFENEKIARETLNELVDEVINEMKRLNLFK